MGIGFVGIIWIAIIAVIEVILSPLTFIGFRKYRRTKRIKWLSLCVPSVLIVIIPIFFAIWSLIHFLIWGNHGPTKTPLESDVIGEYSLTKESRDYLSDQKKYPTIPDSVLIILKQDHRLLMMNFPDCAESGFGKSEGRFVNKTDQWKIGEVSKIDSWMDGRSICNGNFVLLGNPPHFKIGVTIGDPDNGEEIEFQK